jgi:hypothetical protein
MNRNFFNKADKYYENENDDKFEELEDEFQDECEEIAEELMIKRPKSAKEYDLGEFLEIYDKYVKTDKYTLKQALEKFVLDTVYGENKMNAKFKTKHFGSAANKLAKLERIKNYVSQPRNYLNYDKLNDPDYYDLGAASNYTNIDWYYEGLNNRINKYRRLANKKE